MGQQHIGSYTSHVIFLSGNQDLEHRNCVAVVIDKELLNTIIILFHTQIAW